LTRYALGAVAEELAAEELAGVGCVGRREKRSGGVSGRGV